MSNNNKRFRLEGEGEGEDNYNTISLIDHHYNNTNNIDIDIDKMIRSLIIFLVLKLINQYTHSIIILDEDIQLSQSPLMADIFIFLSFLDIQ